MKCGVHIALLVTASSASAQVRTYEGTVFPEVLGWERVGTADADRWIEHGWFFHYADLGAWAPGPFGEQDYYQRSMAEFAGAPAFFVEWRVATDVPSALFDVSGVATVLSVTGTRGVKYHFTLTDDVVRLIRDNFLPIVFVDLDAPVAHTYRLELYGAESYVWSIDGQVIDSGIPENVYPDATSFIIWGTSHDEYDNTARWDYVRFGVIPPDGIGDYDSDGAVTQNDFYFFHECLTNIRPGINGGPDNDAGPGCRFADFDFDSDTDLADFAEFQNTFAAPR